MINISFDFDPETHKVTNVKVDGASKAPSTSKAKAKKATIHLITLSGTSLKLNSTVVESLGVEAGDRLCVRFDKQKVILARPDVLGEDGGGNLITKGLTLSCRGKVGELIAQIGSEFEYTLDSDGYMILHSLTEPATSDIVEQKEIDELDIQDFAPNLDGEEVSFNYTI